jgi:DNA mismatch endonuclease (patch repair protein)
MSGIRGTNTRPEIRVRSLLHHQGFRFRLHVRNLPGKPDIVLPRYRVVMFIQGCFWHGHGCLLFKWPSTRPEFWHKKIENNRENDRQAQEALRASGWRVAVIWECVMKGRFRLDDKVLTDLLSIWIRNSAGDLELASDPEGKT